jgi:hypothetical protein
MADVVTTHNAATTTVKRRLLLLNHIVPESERRRVVLLLLAAGVVFMSRRIQRWLGFAGCGMCSHVVMMMSVDVSALYVVRHGGVEQRFTPSPIE